MVCVRPFKGVRPTKELAEKVASFPYDVLNSKEARELASGNPYSYLHVVKPEIDLPEGISVYDESVYQKAKENLYGMIKDGVLVQDDEACMYVYMQQMGDHKQYGLVVCTSADDYNENKIKKHEYTRKVKEDDRTKHVITLNANAGPVFLTYRDQDSINEIIAGVVEGQTPEYDFTKEDGIGHTVWVIKDEAVLNTLSAKFEAIDALYVADGHHRSASAARAKAEKIKNDANPSADKEYNYFLSVLFPATQLYIMDYNRVVFKLNGNTNEEFMAKVQEKFEIIGEGEHSPKNMNEYGMYLDGKWYQIKAKAGTFPADHPVESLDCAILQANLLNPILGIGDPRVSDDIDFVGGIRGHEELEKRVNSGEAAVAFKLHPVGIDQLMNVADAGEVMPPKSTWFEPKLRSGLLTHLLD
jgi:uncharacterized protein (DUF1015 family)